MYSIYSTLKLDYWRSDSGILLIHHLVTLNLIVISLNLKYIKIILITINIEQFTLDYGYYIFLTSMIFYLKLQKHLNIFQKLITNIKIYLINYQYLPLFVLYYCGKNYLSL